jgi:hypothetical protein
MNPKELRVIRNALVRFEAHIKGEVVAWVKESDRRSAVLRRGFFGRLKWLLLGR